MIERLITWSARNPFLIGLATLLLIGGGVIAMLRTPLDALPDLSDVQVIVYTEVPARHRRWSRTRSRSRSPPPCWPVPHSRVVRGFSFFGASFVYVIFDDGTDLYWARSRVLEYLNSAAGAAAAERDAAARPDATGVGWVYST